MPSARPPRLDDYFELCLLGEPAVSPDGVRVAFTVQRCDREADRDRSAIWVADTAVPGSARPLTAGASRDRSPRWSPDGARLAFISDRAGGRPQIHVLDVGGGEARRIETAEAVAGGLAWTPDGRTLAFTARLVAKPDGWVPYPGAPERASSESPNDSDVKVVTRLLHRADGAGEHGDRRSHVFTVPADGAAGATRVTDGDFDHAYPAFSPDGRFLALAANRRPGDAADLENHTDLWGCELATGRTFLICRPGGPVVAPAWSPDGRRIAFVSDDAAAGRTTSPSCFVVGFAGADAPAQLAQPLGHALDRPVSYPDLTDLRLHTVAASVAWSADGRHVYFPVFDQGVTALHRATLDGATAVVTSPPGPNGRTFGGFSLGGGAPVIAYTGGDAVTPEEVFAFRPGAEPLRLSAVNAEVMAGIRVQPVRRFRFAGADGWPVDGWFLPPAGGGPAPCVVHVHGGPHSAYGDAIQFTMQLLAAEGIASLYVNPRGSQGYGQAFASACAGDWGGKDYLDILAGLDHAVAAGWVDPGRCGITGYSYGGFMTCWAVTQTDRFRAALAGAPIANRHSFYGTSDIGVHFGETEFPGNAWDGEDDHLARSAIRFAGQVRTPILFVHGEADLRCPIGQTEELYTAIRRQGKVAVMVRYPGEFHASNGHTPRHKADRIARMIAWFRHWLLA